MTARPANPSVRHAPWRDVLLLALLLGVAASLADFPQHPPHNAH